MDVFNLIVIVLALALFEAIASIDNAVINAEALSTPLASLRPNGLRLSPPLPQSAISSSNRKRL